MNMFDYVSDLPSNLEKLELHEANRVLLRKTSELIDRVNELTEAFEELREEVTN